MNVSKGSLAAIFFCFLPLTVDEDIDCNEWLKESFCLSVSSFYLLCNIEVVPTYHLTHSRVKLLFRILRYARLYGYQLMVFKMMI